MSSPGEFSRTIFHVDMDSFYASCELSRRPEMKTEPFVVGADPKNGKGRGVVLACNYAAKKQGLKSGMPISRAWELSPQAHYVRPDFEFYGQVSGKVMQLIRNFADLTEQVSIDEAFLDVSESLKRISSDFGLSEEEAIRKLAGEIKKAVRDNQGITCSVGVANSKIVAKIATDMNKPDGLTIVRPKEAISFLAGLPVSKIPGVGRVTQRILAEKFQVETIMQLRKVPVDDLKDAFGRSAVWMLNVANGIDESEVVESWDPVSISSETTFMEDEGDYSKVREVMEAVAKDVFSRVEAEHYLFRNIGIKIRFTGFQTHTRSKSLSAHTVSFEILLRECEKMLSEFYDSDRKVRLIGVRVSSLKKKEDDQKTLMDWQTTG
ncbi:MAG TPA: DNA polymerase IV [Nitrososphaerales archaeon]|nr:DNA polymerase IV [Nitrososphaerales archaeon]